ncbi:MAG: type VI secretion system lipoprotein TssJ [Gammaproteobacteria bacterium HGW-Gammaproteobacteria-11]|nr:MAG: type VI secretion system lipoprotein TssJ [Gammaproteobacteria bacterium HGW-Gammaproteobacteria-11]
MLRIALLSLLLPLFSLSGCAILQSNSVTRIDLTLEGSRTLNPDLNGRPSPIVIRLYELKNPVAFEHTEFFALYQQAPEVLSMDLIASEELELRPGEKQVLKLTTTEQGRYIGVIAAYRNLPEADWRTVISLRPGARNEVSLYLDELSIGPQGSDSAKGN